MGRDKRNANGVHVDGPWVPVPLKFLQSRTCAELSPHALKLLVDLMAMLKPNAGCNGDIWPSADALQVRGWTSAASRTAAMRELREAGLVATTRRRTGRRCELIALTLWPLACDHKKLDVMRFHYSVSDYRGQADAGLAPPTPERPALWKKARPAGAAAKDDLPQRDREASRRPAAGTQEGGRQAYTTRSGTEKGKSGPVGLPLRGAYLDCQSVRSTGTAEPSRCLQPEQDLDVPPTADGGRPRSVYWWLDIPADAERRAAELGVEPWSTAFAAGKTWAQWLVRVIQAARKAGEPMLVRATR